MTKQEKEEVIEKMGLGNKYVNRAVYILNDFANFMVVMCILIIIASMIKTGFVGTLLVLRDCVVIYVVYNVALHIFYTIKRKLKRSKR